MGAAGGGAGGFKLVFKVLSSVKRIIFVLLMITLTLQIVDRCALSNLNTYSLPFGSSSRHQVGLKWDGWGVGGSKF